MTELTSRQRKYLKSLAHHIEPVVIVGKQGVTDALIAFVNKALDDHELIKVRFNEYKDEKKDLAELIRERTASQIAGLIGHVLILYRQQEDPQKRNIELPD